MIYALISLLIAVVLGTFGLLGVLLHRVTSTQEPTSNATRIAELEARMDGLKREVDALPSLWELERERAEEAHELAKKQHRRAAQQRRAAERAADGGEGDEEDGPNLDLFGVDETSGGGDRVQPVPSLLADHSENDLRRRAEAAGVSPFI